MTDPVAASSPDVSARALFRERDYMVYLVTRAFGVLGTVAQIVTPDAMRGRVASVSFLFIGASNELGEFESGVTARLFGPVLAAVFGPVLAAVFGGVASLFVTGLWAWLFPALR